MKNSRGGFYLLASAAFITLASICSATEEDGSWFQKLIPSSGEYSIEETYVGEAGVRSGGRVISDFDESDTILRFVTTPRIKLGVLRFGFEWEHFAFGFPTRTPIPNTLQSACFVAGLDTQISDSILLRFEAQPGMYGTNNLNTTDFNMPFIIGGTYIYNPNLQIILGVSVDVERKYPVIPGAGFRWKIAREWVLNAVMPNPRLEYEPVKNVTLYAGATIKETNFRTSEDFGESHKSRLNHAVLTYNEVRAGVGADWKLTSFLTVSAEVGYQPYRSFDYYRTDLRFHEDGSAPYGMISLHGAF
jgi:hypothetical protein